MNPFRKLLQYLNNSICDSPTPVGRVGPKGRGGGRVVSPSILQAISMSPFCDTTRPPPLTPPHKGEGKIAKFVTAVGA